MVAGMFFKNNSSSLVLRVLSPHWELQYANSVRYDLWGLECRTWMVLTTPAVVSAVIFYFSLEFMFDGCLLRDL